MEKIPYKPGDVLVNDQGRESIILDLSQNSYVAILNYEDYPKVNHNFYTKEELDKFGYTLKNPK